MALRFFALLLCICVSCTRADEAEDWIKMKPLVPRGYVCPRAATPLVIDGKLDDAAWKDAPWSADFTDIEGTAKPAPRFRTRMKMLWDDACLYIAAELSEPHVTASITQKNAVIFYDNDFEVFLNPNGDNHNYHEFEMNALNTIWELDLPKPYKDGGLAINGTNLKGLRSAVHVIGTLNDPRDTDTGWTIEIAIPWPSLSAYNSQRATPPHDGDQWRIDFSRVEWRFDIVDGKYVKVPREKSPEDNWIWSAPGIVDMHRPERWGYVQFTAAAPGTVAFSPDPTLPARDALMEVYHFEKAYFKSHRQWTDSAAALGLPASAVSIQLTAHGFEASLPATVAHGKSVMLHTREDSLIWQEPK